MSTAVPTTVARSGKVPNTVAPMSTAQIMLL